MATVTEVAVPDIGDFEDVPVIEVLVKPGDTVGEEDPLVTLESDKATMEVPSPAAGKVAEIKVAVGDTVSQGTLVLTLETEGDPAVAQDAPDEPAPAEPEGPKAELLEDADEVYASPSVRRRAREQDIDLSQITGSGRGGRITLDDLDQPQAARGEAAASAPPPSSPRSSETADQERVPLTRVQKISGPRLQDAWQTIPHVTQFDEADITDLEAFRKRVNGEQDVKVTMVALLMKACVASLRAHPVVNSSLDGEELVLKRSYHLGFAADTPQGLLVPVIRDVDAKGILDVAAELRELSGRARDGKLKGEEMRGATFTISSLGGIGGTAFTPIINPPEVAILGVSRSQTKPHWTGEAFVPRLLLPLSLSYDHRVIDGALAARFTAHLAGVLGDLKRVLL